VDAEQKKKRKKERKKRKEKASLGGHELNFQK
jgi:hypothetical protein